jgi:hypothetical protein
VLKKSYVAELVLKKANCKLILEYANLKYYLILACWFEYPSCGRHATAVIDV